jgi:pyruvate formate lyase activating enzyme
VCSPARPSVETKTGDGGKGQAPGVDDAGRKTGDGCHMLVSAGTCRNDDRSSIMAPGGNSSVLGPVGNSRLECDPCGRLFMSFNGNLMGGYPAGYWHHLDNGRIQCDLCPRGCQLKTGQRGLCFVRQYLDGQMVLTTYGRSSGFCIDPVEKKPLHHFYPGTPTLSFGTAGCNLSCKFCQNWDISRSKAFDRLTDEASAVEIASAAKRHSCRSVALTYNDPVVFLEYGRDVAAACHELGIGVVVVTNGYINPEPRADFFSFCDAANVDLKAFSQRFYRSLTGGDLQPVLDCLSYIRRKTVVWLEVTTLLIPDENDSDTELIELSKWILNELGPETPVHFSAFHPDFNYRSKPSTPLETLIRAREIARDTGLYHVYTGNVTYPPGDTTYCHRCGTMLIERSWYQLAHYRLTAAGECPQCGTPASGCFDPKPGNWGNKRRPIRLR